MNKFYVFLFLSCIVTFGCNKDETDETPTAEDNTGTIIAKYRSNFSSPAYYINSGEGNDTNDGRSPENAWKTLDRLHKVVLKPGDIVRISRGSVFENQNLFLDNGSAGSKENPVTIEAYGKGNLPVIKKPRALWDKTKAVSGIYIASTSSYITILDLKITETGENSGIYICKGSHHITVAGSEMYRCGTGISVDGTNQKIIGNSIRETGYDGKGSGIGIGFAGSNLEFAWNKLTHCIVLINGTKQDGSPFEYYGRRSDSDYDLSDNISIHHNIVDDCLNFIEAYGNATNMLIAYNVYKNSSASPLQFHLDDCEHPTWTHECTYEVAIENNTFVIDQEPNDGGWGVVGLLVDWNHLPNPDKSRFTVRNNLFVTNHTILSWINPLGNNLVHKNNLFYFLDKGSLTINRDIWSLDASEIIANPEFVDMSKDNFQLRVASPAIKAGTNSSFNCDILGNIVSSEGICDIGAYAFVE